MIISNTIMIINTSMIINNSMIISTTMINNAIMILVIPIARIRKLSMKNNITTIAIMIMMCINLT